MTIQRTTDMQLVRSIMAHPAIYPHIGDDGAPQVEDFEPVDHPSIHYLLATEDGATMGVFLVVPHGLACWEIHTCLLPCAWGRPARRAAREVIAWVWENTTCCRLITNVPSFNRLALKFAEASGMTRFGTNDKSYLKGGTLHDQIMLGISRPEAEPCQR